MCSKAEFAFECQIFDIFGDLFDLGAIFGGFGVLGGPGEGDWKHFGVCWVIGILEEKRVWGLEKNPTDR